MNHILLAAYFATGAAGVAAVYAACRAASRRVRASFTRAHQTIADIQQPRKEGQL